MAGVTVHPDARLRFYQAALLERQSNAQLRFLLLDHFHELFGYEKSKIGVQA